MWSNTDTISEQEALDALRDHCKKLCCWGERPIDKMNIASLEPTTAFKVRTIYTLFLTPNFLRHFLIFLHYFFFQKNIFQSSKFGIKNKTISVEKELFGVK